MTNQKISEYTWLSLTEVQSCCSEREPETEIYVGQMDKIKTFSFVFTLSLLYHYLYNLPTKYKDSLNNKQEFLEVI